VAMAGNFVKFGSHRYLREIAAALGLRQDKCQRETRARGKASFNHIVDGRQIILPGSGFNAHNFVTAHHGLNTQT
jgi:hypothetical protein